MSYKIPHSDKDLVRGCFEATEEVLRDLRTTPVNNKISAIKMEQVPEYRLAIARMFLDLDIDARNK